MITASNSTTPSTSPSQNGKKVNYRLIGRLVLIIAMASGLIWLVWQNQQLHQQNRRLNDEAVQLKNQIKKQTTLKTPGDIKQPGRETPSDTQKPDQPAANPFKPSTEVINNITAILNTLDTRPLEGYLADEVKLFYASSTPATVLTNKTRIAKSLEYFSDAKTPWDLRLPAEQIARYRKKFDTVFSENCLVGASADAGHVVSFCFTKEGKIYSIFLCRDPRVFNN